MPTTIARHAGTVAALGFVLIFFLLALAITGCATQKALPHYTPEQQAAQRAGISYWQPEPAKRDSISGPRVEPNSQLDFIKRIFAGKPPVVQQDLPGDYIATPDSLHFVKVASPHKPTEKRRLFGLLPAKKPASVPQTPIASAQNATQIPRKCKGCTFIVGDNNTVGGKKSGDIIKADSGAIVSKVGGPGNTQTTRGNNNTPTLTAPVQQAPDWRATLAKPAGYVLTALGTVLIVGGCIFLIAAYKRRNLLNNNG